MKKIKLIAIVEFIIILAMVGVFIRQHILINKAVEQVKLVSNQISEISNSLK